MQGQPLPAAELPVHSTPAPATPHKRLHQVEAAAALQLAGLEQQQARNEAVRQSIQEELAAPGGVGVQRQEELEEVLRTVASFEGELPRARSVLAHWLQQARAATGGEAGLA